MGHRETGRDDIAARTTTTTTALLVAVAHTVLFYNEVSDWLIYSYAFKMLQRVQRHDW